MDSVLGLIVVAIVAVFVGFGFGVSAKGESVSADCLNFGAFTQAGSKFTCAPAGEAK